MAWRLTDKAGRSSHMSYDSHVKKKLVQCVQETGMLKNMPSMGEAKPESFVIVEFPGEKDDNGTTALSIVSHKWIVDESGVVECLWPAYFKTDYARLKAVQKHADLRIEQCLRCPIKIKYSTDDYQTAVQKCNDLQDCTSLSSQSEPDLPQNRSMRRRLRHASNHVNVYDAEYSDNDEYYGVPSTEKLNLPSGLPPVLKNLYEPSNNEAILSQASKSQNSAMPDKSSSIPKPSLQKHTSAASTLSMTKSNPQITVPPKSSVPKPTLRSNMLLDVPSPVSKYSIDQSGGLELEGLDDLLTPLETIECTGCVKNGVLLEKILASIQKLSCDVRSFGLISNINEEGNNNNPPGTSWQPARTREDVIRMNQLLEDEAKLANAVFTLQYVGGKDIADTTRRVMSRLLSHDLAVTSNWSGQHNKLNFSKMTNIHKLIILVVRKNRASQHATESEVNSVVKTWLRQAPDRDGGRSSRKKP